MRRKMVGSWMEGEGVRGGEVKSCLLLCGVLEGRPRWGERTKEARRRQRRRCSALPCRYVDDDDDGGGNVGGGGGGVTMVVVVVVEGGKEERAIERERDGEDEAQERRRDRERERTLLSVDLCVVAWPTWRLALRKVRRADQRGGLEGSTGILVKADSSSFACSRLHARPRSPSATSVILPYLALTPLLFSCTSE